MVLFINVFVRSLYLVESRSFMQLTLSFPDFHSAVTCTGLSSSLTNGNVLGTTYTFGKTVKFSCNQGYFITGEQATVKSRTLLCQSNKQWNATEPTCSGKILLELTVELMVDCCTQVQLINCIAWYNLRTKFAKSLTLPVGFIYKLWA